MAKDTARSWVYVAGSFYVHFVMIGFSQSFGILFVELVDFFDSSRTETAVINSLMTGLPFLLGPISGILVSLFGSRKIALFSAVLACSGCVISSQANSIMYLWFSYGGALGISSSLLLLSAVVIVNHNFEKRRSLANSLSSVGGGVGTLSLPPLLRLLVAHYTWRGAVLITGGVFLHCAVFGAMYRSLPSTEAPESQKEEKTSTFALIKTTLNLFKDFHFMVFVISGLLGALAYLIPFNHVPDHVRDLDIDQDEAAWLISAMGIAGIFGRIILGCVTDFERVRPPVMFGIASILCGVTVGLIPTLYTFQDLIICLVVFGFFLGFWLSTTPVVIIDFLGEDKIGTGFGFLSGFQGVAFLLGSPLAGWLYDATGSYKMAFYVAGGLFGAGGGIILLHQVIVVCAQKKDRGTIRDYSHRVCEIYEIRL